MRRTTTNAPAKKTANAAAPAPHKRVITKTTTTTTATAKLSAQRAVPSTVTPPSPPPPPTDSGSQEAPPDVVSNIASVTSETEHGRSDAAAVHEAEPTAVSGTSVDNNALQCDTATTGHESLVKLHEILQSQVYDVIQRSAIPELTQTPPHSSSYIDCIHQFADLQAEIQTVQTEISNLQQTVPFVIAEKQQSAVDIHHNVSEFIRQCTHQARDVKGKPVPRNVLNELENQYAAKLKEIDQLNAESMVLEMRAKELDAALKLKEKEIRDLNPIDNEQLYIENKRFRDTINARLEGIKRLQCKVDANMGSISQLGVKISAIEEDNRELEATLSALHTDYTEARDALTTKKKHRDSVRQANNQLHTQKALAHSRYLRDEFKSCEAAVSQKRQELTMLKQRHQLLTSNIPPKPTPTATTNNTKTTKPRSTNTTLPSLRLVGVSGYHTTE